MLWRRALAVAIAAATAFALYDRVVIPYRCNNAEGLVRRSTDRLMAERDLFAVRPAAERNIATLSDCIDHCPTDVNVKMLTASNLTLLGHSTAAATLLTDALRYDRRPELHLALGIAQTANGERDAALENFVQAGDFAGFDVLADIPDGDLRMRAYERVGERYERALMKTNEQQFRNLVTNGTFTRGGSPVTSTRRGLGPSAAAGWQLLNSAATPISSAIEAAPAGRRGNAMHIVTTTANSGLRQLVLPMNKVPRAVTTAWVYVVRGSVYLGTGSGTRPFDNVHSRTTGQWERLEAMNDSCPARVVMIYAASPGGAEFYVADVTSRQTFTAIPCNR